MFLYFLSVLLLLCCFSTANFQLQKNKEISPEIKKSSSLNISSCLLVVACLFVQSIPTFVHIGLRQTSKETEFTLDNAQITGLWAHTIASINSTFNCLIFNAKTRHYTHRGDESNQKHENMSKRPVLVWAWRTKKK